MANVLVSEDRIKGIEARLRRIEGMKEGRGISIAKPPGGIIISAKPSPTAVVSGATISTFLAKIGTATPDGADTNRWTYAFEEMTKGTAVGYAADCWISKEGGRTGTAYNYKEVYNSDTPGVQGNGIDTSKLPASPATFALSPVPPIGLVEMTEVKFKNGDGDPVTEYWFSYSNAVNGSCTES